MTIQEFFAVGAFIIFIVLPIVYLIYLVIDEHFFYKKLEQSEDKFKLMMFELDREERIRKQQRQF